MTTPARAPRRRPTGEAPPARPANAGRAARPPRSSPRPQPRPTTRSAPRAMPASGAARGQAAAATAPRRATRPDPPHLEVVTPATRRKLRLRILGGLAFTVLFGALLGLAVFHSMLVQGQLGLDRADKEIQQEQMRERELRQQAAQLGAPERILAAAAALGMVQPDTREYLPAVVPGSVVPPPEAGG